MANLTNPINKQNIVDRFADYVVATANSGISWGTNSIPTYGDGTVVAGGQYFGGDTGGKPIPINGSRLERGDGIINAANILQGLVDATYWYTSIRVMRAVLYVTVSGGSPWNTGSRPGPGGVVYDQTAVAHMMDGYRQGFNWPGQSDVASNNKITASGLEQWFANLRSTYTGLRANQVYVQTNVCHASCHNSCHSSRIRR